MSVLTPIHNQLSQPVLIGNTATRNRVALAPMAGLTDVPFRTVAWQMGAGYMVSEMVSSQPQLWDSGKSKQRRIPVPGVAPVAVQIAGTQPGLMAEAAQRHEDDGVQVIDINFGCPAKKVCRKAAGSALLANIDQISEIVYAVCAAVKIPVTVKTRTGLVPGDGLGLVAAKAAAQAGAQMIVLHGRSRACRFQGFAQHHTAGELKRHITVPLLVNGDLQDLHSVRTALRLSGADGVMIGRGAIGKPWLFRELLGQPPLSAEQKWQLVLDHVAAMHSFYGEEMGVRIARKHVLSYLQKLDPGRADPASGTKYFHTIKSASGQLDWLLRRAERLLQAA